MEENQKNKIESLLNKIDISQKEKKNKKNIHGKPDDKSNEIIRLSLRLSVEMVSALGVGVFMGLLIDHFFDTYPLGFIFMFILGAFAGIWNVFKVLGFIQDKKSVDSDK